MRAQDASQYADDYFFREQAIVVPVLITNDLEGAAYARASLKPTKCQSWLTSGIRKATERHVDSPEKGSSDPAVFYS